MDQLTYFVWWPNPSQSFINVGGIRRKLLLESQFKAHYMHIYIINLKEKKNCNKNRGQAFHMQIIMSAGPL